MYSSKFLNFLKNIQVRKLLQHFNTFLIGLHDLLIVEENPRIPNPDVSNIMPRMHRGALVRNECLESVLGRYIRRASHRGGRG